MMAALAILLVSVGGCFNPASPEMRTTWDAATATGLGITAGPITAEQAKQIAAIHAGGTAISADAGDVDGTAVYIVKVQAGNSENGVTTTEVKVRVSDGAVMTMEAVDDDDDGGCGGHDDDDDD
jgi:hypothetical protein